MPVFIFLDGRQYHCLFSIWHSNYAFNSSCGHVFHTVGKCMFIIKTAWIGKVVGARGFEPPTPATPLQCATRLRHAPTFIHQIEAIALNRKEQQE